MVTNEGYILTAENIHRSFAGVKALQNVSIHIRKGEVHALMGENGAGKSTFMKILTGMLSPDAGRIFFKGNPVVFRSSYHALQQGIAMIHQELLLFPDLTVAENIFIGNEPSSTFFGWINKEKLNRDATAQLRRLGSEIPVTKKLKELTIAEMQLVEIAKALANNSSVLIMDEPTSAISGREVEMLFRIINELKDQGVAIIYISHKMDEILRIADTITVMRDGKCIATRKKEALDNRQLISMIVGREFNTLFKERNDLSGEVVFSVSGLSGDKFRNISFEVRKGEILGIAGLMGSGRTEIVSAIFGLNKITNGIISIKGKEVKIDSPRSAIRLGIGLVSEDRKSFGLVMTASVKHNITLSSLRQCSFGPFISSTKENTVAGLHIKNLRIKATSGDQLVSLLSGGNQQKVVLARMLMNDSDIIILDEPTRGIDIGAKAEIYDLMSQLSERGKAIIMISSELPEILGMSDRILVISRGNLQVELKRSEASQELIMEHAML